MKNKEYYYILKEVTNILENSYLSIRKINNYKQGNKYFQSLGLFFIIGIPEPFISNIIGLKLLILSKILSKTNYYESIYNELNKIRIIKKFYEEIRV
jgi:hypothetical protein